MRTARKELSPDRSRLIDSARKELSPEYRASRCPDIMVVFTSCVSFRWTCSCQLRGSYEAS
eukprot:3506586-Pyramimonas_sp.AAC.1